ncbi:MAG: polysaccharide deacetylase family protein [Clostridia bacterium]|nr:polysaccharide deacetylase family protein [Clostridiales bacterium]MBQ9856431.1 polysaccharide deacetylase family protein [Clostridia bacterium]
MIRAILTIDDISSKNTPEIVDFLCEKGIMGVLFARGSNVEKYYAEAIYAVKKGMIVGNHSYSHPAFSAIPLEEGIKDIEKCEKVLDRLYLDSGEERKYRPFRFPYGDKGGENREKFQKYLKDNGFHKLDDRLIPYPWWREGRAKDDIDTFWTYDFEEYRLPWNDGFTKKSVLEKMNRPDSEGFTALYGENKGHILLMHAHDETDKVWPKYYKEMIECAIQNGVVFEKPVFL